MMLALDGQTRAMRIVDRVMQVANERADNERPDDWSQRQTYCDFVYMLRSIEAYTDGPEWAPTVEVRARMRPDGGYWTGTPAAILDKAAGLVDLEAGDDFTFRNGQIESVDGEYRATLTWTSKPNLQRLFDDDDPGPMVAITFGGRTYHLDAWTQGSAADVASWYPDRHGRFAAQYGRALLRLAEDLGTDTLTAQRIADVAVPDRNFVTGVDVERNEHVQILSAEQEAAITTIGSRPVRPGRGVRYTCTGCGAGFDEDCLVQGCQGSWG
jgi:hypothetical protein